MRARDLIACVATLAAASSVAVVASRAAAEDEREADANAYGFDHLLHEGKVAVSGAEPIDCSTCHSVDASGAINGFPGHSACYGACHGETPRPRVIPRSGDAAPYPIADGRKRTCENCHSPAVLDRVIAGSRDPLAASYPPYRVDPDYGLVMSHPKHATATADARSCRTCHEVPADVGGANGKTTATTRAPHARCVGCHINPSDPTTPTMSQCTTCHLGAYGPAARPHHSPGEFTTRSAFSHAAHLSRADSKCVTCHTAVATTEGIVLPTPTKAECAACHDGDAAFSMLEARCTTCHAEAPEYARPRAKPGARFSHRRHAERSETECAACHSLSATGAPLPPARSHVPCSDAGCHREQFATVETTICGACHVGDEPWRPLHFDRPPRAITEFGASFGHDTHLSGDTPLISDSCDHCHGADGSRGMRLPHDHAACSGAGCHDRAGKSNILRDDCQGCHVAGLIETRNDVRIAAEWSVRAKFRHAPHTDACTTCHDSVIDSDALADIAPPTKQTCAGCHDGGQAFKLTGHSCARCHGK